MKLHFTTFFEKTKSTSVRSRPLGDTSADYSCGTGAASRVRHDWRLQLTAVSCTTMLQGKFKALHTACNESVTFGMLVQQQDTRETGSSAQPGTAAPGGLKAAPGTEPELLRPAGPKPGGTAEPGPAGGPATNMICHTDKQVYKQLRQCSHAWLVAVQ